MSKNNPHDVLDARAREFLDWSVSSLTWHEATAPKRVHDAYAAINEALAVRDELEREFRELRTADERQEQERRDAHAAHLAGGPAPKAYKRVDYLSPREDKLLAVQAAHQRARVMRGRYDALENDPDVMAEERDTLIKALHGEHARMAELVVEAERAYQRFALIKERAELLSLKGGRTLGSFSGEAGSLEEPAGVEGLPGGGGRWGMTPPALKSV